MRLTNASVIRRIWSDQSDFQSDLIARVVADVNEAGQLIAARDLLIPLLQGCDLSTPEHRWRSIGELARLGGEGAIGSRVGTRNWELWVGVWVVSVTSPGDRTDARVHQALADGLALTGAAWDDLSEAIMEQLGFRVKEPFTLRQYTDPWAPWPPATHSARPAVTSHRSCNVRPDRTVSSQEWTLMGIALEALAGQYLEIDPDWRPRH